MDGWGSTTVLSGLRHIFRGQELPLDAKPSDILFFVDEMIKNDKKGAITWRPSRVQFTGPKCPPEDYVFRKDRITVVFGVIADGRRVIEDIAIG